MPLNRGTFNSNDVGRFKIDLENPGSVVSDGISFKFLAAAPNDSVNKSGNEESFRRMAVFIGPDFHEDFLPAALITPRPRERAFIESAETFARVIEMQCALNQNSAREVHDIDLAFEPAILFHASIGLLKCFQEHRSSNTKMVDQIEEFWVRAAQQVLAFQLLLCAGKALGTRKSSSRAT